MRIAIVTAVALLGAVAAFDSASADPYAWCAYYAGRSGATNCYFKTLGQCQAAISGVGGVCRPNTFYTGPDERAPRRKKKRRTS